MYIEVKYFNPCLKEGMVWMRNAKKLVSRKLENCFSASSVFVMLRQNNNFVL